MTKYSELITYWETMPSLISGIGAVRVGDDEAIVELQNTRITYPILWVETPTVRFVNPGGVPAKRFRFAIVVLINEPKKSTTEANTKLSNALEIMELVYAQVYNDAEAGDDFLLVLDDTDNEPIRHWSADNCYGWRMEIDIELERCECPPD